MSKFLMSLLILVVGGASLHAQSNCSYQLKGIVKSEETNLPIPYASVWIKDIASGTVTDGNGNFMIQNLCRQTYTLILSHVDCENHTQQIIIDGNTEGVFLLHHHEKILNNVVVTSKRVALENTQAQSVLDAAELDKNKGQNLGEMLKSLAGVSSLNVGSTISKPVVQGLHSDRVLIFNNGVRQEGQQWGLDHAPEIDPFIANKVTVVKGASSIKYGVGAIGGVILVEPRALRDTIGVGGEMNMVGATNGRMGVLSSMVEGKNQRFAWRLQGTAKKSGSLHTPQYFLNNTGLEELNGSAMLGFRIKETQFEAFYSHFYSKIGILKESHIGNVTDLKDAIERGNPATNGSFTYALDRPAQRINHDIVKLKAQMPTSNAGRLSVTTFFQYDVREEFDAHRPGGKKPTGFDKADVAFQLPSVGVRTDWEHRPLSNVHGGGGFEGQYQTNNTFAGALIPDYRQSTIGAYWTERWRKYPSPLEIEAGLRYDKRYLAIDSTRFGERNRQFDFGNISASGGILYHLGKKGKITVNISTAWRSPNVNELFSNGVHHGTASFEQGNPNLKPERAVNTSLSAQYAHRFMAFEASVFQNAISDFIFLKPEATPVLTIRGAFPAFSYDQTDAILRGGDFSINFNILKNIDWKIKGSTLFAQNKIQKEWLPLMPTDRLETILGIDNQSFKFIKNGYAELSLLAVRRQTRIPTSIFDYQAPPAGYGLVGATIGGDVTVGKRHISIILKGDNLLNNPYRDYLDRLRYFALAAGRNVSIKLKTFF